MRAVLLSLALVALAAAPARADVLVNAPKPMIHCGERIELGVWYRDFPERGHREVTIEVRTVGGAVVFHRRVKAPSTWRYWRYHPACGRRYVVRYRTHAGLTTFRVRVRDD